MCYNKFNRQDIFNKNLNYNVSSPSYLVVAFLWLENEKEFKLERFGINNIGQHSRIKFIRNLQKRYAHELKLS